MLKIKIECWWADANSINERIIRQFVGPKDLEKYQFVNTEQDFTIVLGNTNFENIETKKDNTFYISQETLWSPNEPKDNIHNFCSKILIADKTIYPNRPEYIETFLPMLYAGRGENDYREEWDWSYKLKNKSYVKNKPISVIVRKYYGGHYAPLPTPNLSKELYEFRTNLADKLSENQNIDIFGTNWEKNENNIKGEIWNKHVGLDDYFFSLCMENSIQKNYVSEKFWDAILTNTIPLYIGCNNIKEFVDNDCFFYLNDLTTDEIEDNIKEIIENYKYIYGIRKNKIEKLKESFFVSPTYNLWEKIKEIINEN